MFKFNLEEAASLVSRMENVARSMSNSAGTMVNVAGSMVGAIETLGAYIERMEAAADKMDEARPVINWSSPEMVIPITVHLDGKQIAETVKRHGGGDEPLGQPRR